jgi:hypothetical protein
MMADPPEPEPEPGIDKMTVANSCLLATVTIVLGAMLVVTYKVFKIVRIGDLKMLLMLIFLDLALIGKPHLSHSFYYSKHVILYNPVGASI